MTQTTITKGQLRGWRHDGGGVCPMQTRYDNDVAAFDRAQAADPGHVRGIYYWTVEGYSNLFGSESDARAFATNRADA